MVKKDRELWELRKRAPEMDQESQRELLEVLVSTLRITRQIVVT